MCYDFTSTSDTQQLYTGSLKNGARLTMLEDIPILDLGESNGYFDFGTSLGSWVQTFDDYTISMDLFLPLGTDVSGNGNFIWCFAKSSSEGYLFSNAKDTRMAITKTSYNEEQGIVMGMAGASRCFDLLDEQQEKDEGYVTLVHIKKHEDGTFEETNEKTRDFAWKHPHQADGEYLIL